MAGYEVPTEGTGAGARGSFVVFMVRCSQTRPGEAVFVVGGHEALGTWKTAMALPMTTSADTFPNWKSGPVPLPAGYNVEYKFIVQKESREGAQWQSFQGNYRVTPVQGQVLQAASDWDKASAEVSSLGCLSQAFEEKEEPKGEQKEQKEALRAMAKQEKEEILLKMAESAVDKAAAEVTSTCPLAVTLENREMRRRNFSQSLLALDVVDGEKNEAKPKESEATEEAKEEKSREASSEAEKAEKAENATTEPPNLEAPAEVKDKAEMAEMALASAQVSEKDVAPSKEAPLKETSEVPNSAPSSSPLLEATGAKKMLKGEFWLLRGLVIIVSYLCMSFVSLSFSFPRSRACNSSCGILLRLIFRVVYAFSSC